MASTVIHIRTRENRTGIGFFLDVKKEGEPRKRIALKGCTIIYTSTHKNKAEELTKAIKQLKEAKTKEDKEKYNNKVLGIRAVIQKIIESKANINVWRKVTELKAKAYKEADQDTNLTTEEKEALRYEQRGKQSFLKLLSDEVSKKNGSTRQSWIYAESYFKGFIQKDELRINEINVKLLNDFILYMQDQGLGNNTLKTYFVKIKTVLKICFDTDSIRTEFYRKVKLPKVDLKAKEILTIEEVDKLINTPCKSENIKKAFLFSCFTGLRYSDVKALKWNQIKGLELHYKAQKTGKNITHPLNKQALELIGARPQNEDLNVFNKIIRNSLQSANIQQWVNDAGIDKKITFHCARGSYATVLLSIGTPLHVVQKLLNHSAITLTAQYAKVLDSSKREAVDKLKFGL